MQGMEIIALDELRERSGKHPCERRRCVAQLQADFPTINFNYLQHDVDKLWHRTEEEYHSVLERLQRVVDLLTQK